MKTRKRTIAALLAAATAVLGTVAVAAPAAASAPFTDSAHISGNYDLATTGIWAKLDYTRFVTATATGGHNWTVTLKDTGTFSTIPGRHYPGGGAGSLKPANGTFTGVYAFKVVSNNAPVPTGHHSYSFNCNVNGSGNRVNDCTLPTVGGQEIGTSEWPKLFFPAGAVTAGNWTWTYQTACEKWVNSNAGDSGNITGKDCRPSHDNGHGDDHGDNGHNNNDHGHKPTTRPVFVKPLIVKQPTCNSKYGAFAAPKVKGLEYFYKGHELTHAVQVKAGKYPVNVKAEKGYKLVGTSHLFAQLRDPRCRPQHSHNNGH